MVITVDIYKEIRKRRLEGESQRGIARALGISRNTVKKYWEGERVPGKRIERPREPSVLTPEVRAFIDSCLKSDEDSPGKQRHTAKRIYDRLMSMLPFQSLSFSTLEGRKGRYALIAKDENRFQKLVLRKPSVRKKLQQPLPDSPTAAKKKPREQER